MVQRRGKEAWLSALSEAAKKHGCIDHGHGATGTESEQVAVARMQHRAGAVERSEARQARIVALRVFGCVPSCIAVAVSILACAFRAMSFRRRSVPSVSSFNTHSCLDQDRRAHESHRTDYHHGDEWAEEHQADWSRD